jgi:hypothetical protein
MGIPFPPNPSSQVISVQLAEFGWDVILLSSTCCVYAYVEQLDAV